MTWVQILTGLFVMSTTIVGSVIGGAAILEADMNYITLRIDLHERILIEQAAVHRALQDWRFSHDPDSYCTCE